MKLSVALATHNEEKNIIRTLESVYDWVDEIIIVDGESTDGTIEVITKFDKDGKVKIFQEPNPPMFHINKQKAIEKCTGEWILQLDADEVVSAELKREVQSVVSDGKTSGVKEIPTDSAELTAEAPEVEEERPVAYWLPRLNYFLGRPLKKGGQYPDYTIRLYKNGIAKFPCKSVHEQVEINQSQSEDGRESVGVGSDKTNSTNSTRSRLIQPQIGILKSNLLHYPYPTFKAYLDKWVRYSMLEAQLLYDQGVRPSWISFIKYMIVYPKWWFFKTYFRHRGYIDGFPGFAFSLFSALRYCATYAKLYEIADTSAG